MWLIENWSFVSEQNSWSDPNKFVRPGTKPSYAIGNISGRRPLFLDGEPFYTSPIAEYNSYEGIIKTLSGSTYKLGTINKEYQEYLRAAKSV